MYSLYGGCVAGNQKHDNLHDQNFYSSYHSGYTNTANEGADGDAHEIMDFPLPDTFFN